MLICKTDTIISLVLTVIPIWKSYWLFIFVLYAGTLLNSVVYSNVFICIFCYLFILFSHRYLFWNNLWLICVFKYACIGPFAFWQTLLISLLHSSSTSYFSPCQLLIENWFEKISLIIFYSTLFFRLQGRSSEFINNLLKNN